MVGDQMEMLIPVIIGSALVMILVSLVTALIVRRKKAGIEQQKRVVVDL